MEKFKYYFEKFQKSKKVIVVIVFIALFLDNMLLTCVGW